MADHFFLGDAEGLPDRFLYLLRILRRSPQEDLAIAIVGERNGRFHGGVSKMGNVVVGFDHLAALANSASTSPMSRITLPGWCDGRL